VNSPSTSAAFPWRAALGVLAVAVIAFARTLGGGFLGDDFVYIARFHTMPWSEWPGLFTREWSDGVWGFPLKELRPFAALTIMIDARLWGDAAFGYRLTNLAIFLLSAVLVVALGWRYSQGRVFAAFCAGALFVLHPIQAEPVAWITGRVDLLAVCAALAFWWGAEKFTDAGRPAFLALAFAALFIGVFSKELCLLAPLLLAAFWLVLPSENPSPWRRRLLVLAAVAVAVAAYAVCRHAAFGASAATPNATWSDPGAWQRQAGYFAWLFPWSPYFHRLELAGPVSPNLMRILCAALAVLAVVVLFLARRASPISRAAIFFGGVWWIGTVLTLVVVPYFSPRHLHFGSVGLALSGGLALGLFSAAWSRTGTAAAMALWFGSAQFAALGDWRETGRLSHEAHGRIRAALASDVAPPVVVFSVPPLWRTAWLWSWSTPHLAQPPFVARTTSGRQVFGSPPNYYRPDHWAKEVAAAAPGVIRAQPRIHALHLGADGRITSRDLQGDQALAAAVELEQLLVTGIDESKWTAWVRRLASP